MLLLFRKQIESILIQFNIYIMKSRKLALITFI
jgi:hypothetical protein